MSLLRIKAPTFKFSLRLIQGMFLFLGERGLLPDGQFLKGLIFD